MSGNMPRDRASYLPPRDIRQQLCHTAKPLVRYVDRSALALGAQSIE